MLKLTNNAIGLLGASIGTGATTITLAAGSGSKFPVLVSGDWFPVTVVSASDPSQFEIMRATARSGDIITVVRAQEGTTAKSFAAGDVVEHRLTAAAMNQTYPQVSDGRAENLRFSVVGVQPRTLTIPDRDVVLGTAAEKDDDRYAHRDNNLSDLSDAETARSNLGLGDVATMSESELTEFVGADAVPVGGYVEVQANLSGSAAPPAANYIRLIAGQSGSGQYNEGKLSSESVSGSAPLINATAVISDPESPMNGQTVRLLETERRFMRAGNIGAVENDMMQTITGTITALRWGSTETSASGAFSTESQGSNTPSSGNNGGVRIDFDSSNSPGSRTGPETRPRNIGVAVYMRIK